MVLQLVEQVFNYSYLLYEKLLSLFLSCLYLRIFQLKPKTYQEYKNHYLLVFSYIIFQIWYKIKYIIYRKIKTQGKFYFFLCFESFLYLPCFEFPEELERTLGKLRKLIV